MYKTERFICSRYSHGKIWIICKKKKALNVMPPFLLQNWENSQHFLLIQKLTDYSNFSNIVYFCIFSWIVLVEQLDNDYFSLLSDFQTKVIQLVCVYIYIWLLINWNFRVNVSVVSTPWTCWRVTLFIYDNVSRHFVFCELS